MPSTKSKDIAILLGVPPKGKGAEEESSEGASEEELQVAADEVFDAVKGGDRAGFATALRSYVQLCDMAGD